MCIELLGGGRWPLSGDCRGLGWGCVPYFGGGGVEWGALLVVWCPAVRGGWFGGAGGVAMWDGSRDIWSQIHLLIPLKFNK